MVTDFDNPPASVLRPMKLAHVVLRTTDLPRLEKYYLAFLDATVSFKNEMMSFLRYDEEHHRIGMLAIPGSIPKVPKAAGLAHIAFTYGTLSDLLKSYRKRKSAGIVPTWCVNHGPTISIYYKDPDGNEIETQVDIRPRRGRSIHDFWSIPYKPHRCGLSCGGSDSEVEGWRG